MTEDRLTILYKTYGPAIYIRCRSILSDEAEAHDATQETFVRVYRHLSEVPSDREALYWIYRVATNFCLNELRNRKNRPLVHRTGAEEAPSLNDLERRIVNRDLAARLIEAAHPKVKPVAWLYHVDGMDQEEVACILDLSRRTVATRLAAFATTAQKLLRRSESWV
jgi:RNA polymerase sigma-70 factor (ECF subfamily)